MNPSVVILANDINRFESFAAHLEKTGYPAKCLKAMPEGNLDPTTVFFVSFNLTSEPAIDLGKTLEQRFACIVFAEDTGTQNAAKLGSAKFGQTLQHPYTEKNFVMAVQTIVKKRKAQFEKDERKRLHDEKMKARQNAKEGPKSGGIHIQEAAENLIDDGARVFKGEKPTEFFIIQDSAKEVTGGRFDIQPAGTKKKTFEEITISLENPKKTEEEINPKTATLAIVPDTPLQDEYVRKEVVVDYERPMSHFWAVLGMCFVGSAICLYCVYQVLFNM